MAAFATMRYLGATRVLFGLSARAAYPIGAPLFVGIAIVASVLFGPTGMQASDVIRAVDESTAFAIALWTGWILLSLPVARPALAPKPALYLRWLPAPAWVFWIASGSCLFIVEAPFILLFGRGASVLAGLSAGLVAVAAHALVIARSRRLEDIAAAALVVAVILARPAPVILAPLSFVAAISGLRAALRRAPEVGGFASLPNLVPRSPLPAVAVTLTASVIRGEPFVLGRAAAIAGVGGLVIPLAAAGHDLTEPASIGTLAIGVAVFALAPGLFGIASAVFRAERASEWILDATGTPHGTRAIAAAVSSGSLGAMIGLVLGAIASVGVRGSSGVLVGLRVSGIALVIGFLTGAAFSGVARAAGGSPRRGDRGPVAALIWTFGVAVAAELFGERSLFLLAGVAVILVVRDARRASLLYRKRQEVFL